MKYVIQLKTGIACYDVGLVNEWIRSRGEKVGTNAQTRSEQLQGFLDEQSANEGLPLVKVVDWEME